MKTINPYLNFKGKSEEAFNFYKSVFGGEFYMLIRNKDSPEAARIPTSEGNKIMHISLPIKGNVLMATDVQESMEQNLIVGNNFYLTVHTDSKEEADEIFKKLSIDGKITIPQASMSWGDYFGQLTDQFGIQWMIIFSTMGQ